MSKLPFELLLALRYLRPKRTFVSIITLISILGVALDNSGANLSGTNQVSFIYVVSATLTVSTNGLGSLSPNYNGALLQIGKSYSMTATAAAGFAFVNWTGNITTNGATLQFTMASNLTFTANFVDKKTNDFKCV